MRNFDDPEYVKWRADVRKRDKYKCRKCGSSKKLQIHHIKSWATAPLLRFDISNGITLCKTCHSSMWGNEDNYEKLCRDLLVNKKVLADILFRLYQSRQKDVQDNS